MTIRLVTFDALHTLITPRRPTHVQYSEVFTPFLGIIDPVTIKHSFKLALKEVQIERPAYVQGAEAWWKEVIRRTALGAGADEQKLDATLSRIVPTLLKRFSSKEGYDAFHDSISTVQRLHEDMGILTAVVSNGDSRLRSVMQDLEFPVHLQPIILSGEEGVEKPSSEIFERALSKLEGTQHPISLSECLHVGDELVCDYQGAMNAGMHALLLRRYGVLGEQAHKESDEDLNGVSVIGDLNEILTLLKSGKWK